ncbi:MAG TPA: crotonase/enoyl-CoA hydratase family protein [Micropepsaceae bacterium]|nr:crotonase/enoyl-CoA hydratase family protein [Micropepsaceae bacterium]
MHDAAETADPNILVERCGAIQIMTINRPRKMNALTPEMFVALADAYTALDADPDLRVGILAAAGDHFTAGLELTRFHEGMKKGDSGATGAGGKVDPFALRRKCRKPVIAAVKGIVYTAGLEMMLAADIAIAARSCRFSQLEPRRGVMAAGGGTIRFVERCGWGNAMYHLLTADEFDAGEALRIGIVQEVVETGTELQRALALAEKIARLAPLAVMATRESSLTFVELGEAAAIAALPATQQRLAMTADAAEGVRSFIERREGRFTGT